MKDISELNIPGDIRYSDDHEWARRTSDAVRIGISDFAQNQLGDVVYVELPEIGQKFKVNEAFGNVESVKAVSEMLMPVGGEIVRVNENLKDRPELVNTSPYEDGWMIEVKESDPSHYDKLMDSKSYIEFLKQDH